MLLYEEDLVMKDAFKIDGDMLEKVVGGLEEEVICSPSEPGIKNTDDIVAEYNCNRCGNTFIYPPGATDFTCTYCGEVYSVRISHGRGKRKR